MTRALDIRERQVRAIIRAARKEGVHVKIEIGGAVIHMATEDEIEEIDDGEEIKL